MNSRRNGNTVIVRLDRGDEICSSLLAAAQKEGIRGGSVSGIGATDSFTVGVFDLEKGGYERFDYSDGNYEIVSLLGNLSVMNGEAYQHLHIVCAGRDGRVAGGHLLRAVISLTCEIFITVTDEIGRGRNEELGINTLSL